MVLNMVSFGRIFSHLFVESMMDELYKFQLNLRKQSECCTNKMVEIERPSILISCLKYFLYRALWLHLFIKPQEEQSKRAGGTVCVNLHDVWLTFNTSVLQIQPCTKPYPSFVNINLL